MNTGEDEKNGLMCRRGTGKRVCRYRLSAFGEFYKIYQEVLETEGTVALTVVVKEDTTKGLSLQKLIRCSKKGTETH